MNARRAGVLGAAVTAGARRAIEALDRQHSAAMIRTNFRGRQVSLSGGLSTAAGCVAAAIGAGGRPGAAAALVTTSAGVLGAIDDRSTDAGDKGLRGHLRALAAGRLTTGGAKLLGISGTAVLAAGIATDGGRRPGSSAPGGGTHRWARGRDVLTCAGLIAGCANLLNLFDLRPGRALKVAGALSLVPAAATGPASALAAGSLGVIGASLPGDLAEETMLGDAGANALGALVGTALALHPRASLRTGALAGVVTLTVLSEKVSFSRVIEAAPPLRALDAWGRSG